MDQNNALVGRALWNVFTRFGEAQVLLPAIAVVVIALARNTDTRPLALRWALCIAVATIVTTVSKIAFIGWGIGWPALNFTGFSGHSMYASAVYPVLGAISASKQSRSTHLLAVATGCAIAILVALSRVVISVHSWSEIIGGLAIGFVVSATAIKNAGPLRVQLHPVFPFVLALWIAFAPGQLPPSTTHALVTRVALTLAGRESPFTRENLSAGPSIPNQ